MDEKGKKKQHVARTMPEQRLLTVEQVAHLLGLSVRGLYNACCPHAKNPFPIRAKRIGRALRFDRREVEAFIENL